MLDLLFYWRVSAVPISKNYSIIFTVSVIIYDYLMKLYSKCSMHAYIIIQLYKVRMP